MNKDLLPPNATAQEQALSQTVARLADIPVPLATLWQTEHCPESLLPWLAWALSVDTWDSDWLVETKRNVIADSVAVHQQKGTLSAIHRVLNSLGVIAEIEEWFHINGAPHTFQLTAWVNDQLATHADALLGPSLYRNLQQLVDQVKPVRSHYDLRVGALFDSRLQLATIASGWSLLRKSMALKSIAALQPLPMPTAVNLQAFSVIRVRLTVSA